jgi:uncharacterized BrkB/YihY/UPF0761 family membrane protein
MVSILDKYKRIFIEIIKIIKNQEANWISNSLAYSFIVAFVPIVFAAVIIALRYFVNIQDIDHLLKNNQISIPYINNIVQHVQEDFSNTSILLTIFLVIYSIYMGSTAIRSMIQANNLFFDFKPRSFIYNWSVSFLVIIILLIAVYSMIAIIGFLPSLFHVLHLDFAIGFIHFLILPILVLIMYVIFKLTTGFRLKGSTIIIGSIVTSIGITILITFSSNIISGSTIVSEIFGPLITILLFAHFLYFISLCIYYGMVVNVATYRVEHQIKQEKIIYENTIYPNGHK